MKTDELIGVLSSSFAREPARSSRIGSGIAGGVGVLASLCLAMLALGPRPDLMDGRAVLNLLGKVAFAGMVGGIGLWFLSRIIRPGGEGRVHLGLVAVPFAFLAVLACVSLAYDPATHWTTSVASHTWVECLISIPVIAVLPFALLMWVVRRIGAPTDLVRTGALVGLAAGSVSAVGYALHCMDDTVPFVAVWYGGTILLCALAGALLGPRLLRW